MPYFFLSVPPTLVIRARRPTYVPNGAVGHVVHAMELGKIQEDHVVNMSNFFDVNFECWGSRVLFDFVQ